MTSTTETLDLLRAVRKREDGQTMAEYGVVLAVICVATVAVFTAFEGGIAGSINRVLSLIS